MAKEEENKSKQRTEEEKPTDGWVPKTKLGRMVRDGEITSLEQIYEKDLAILEPEIVDRLVPDLQDEVLSVCMVQRTTDSGRRGSFMVTVVVGNRDGYIGFGNGKGVEVRPAIERAIREAKKNVTHVRRGCGSWECGCDGSHSVPFQVSGKSSSVSVKITPAPKGTGVVAAKTVRKVLELAGIKDAWTKARGRTETTFNFAQAAFRALKKTRKTKLMKEVGKL